jgi:hypothetical protein
MKIVMNPKKLVDAGSLAASFNSDAIEVLGFFGLFVQAVVSSASSLNGTLKLQYSNKRTEPTDSDPTWLDLPTDASLAVNPQTITADGAKAWEYPKVISYRWIRLVYTRTGGSGTLNAEITGVRL